jgi:hypothetical protein
LQEILGGLLLYMLTSILHPMSPSLLRADEVSEDSEQKLVTVIFFHDEGWGSDGLTPCEWHS